MAAGGNCSYVFYVKIIEALDPHLISWILKFEVRTRCGEFSIWQRQYTSLRWVAPVRLLNGLAYRFRQIVAVSDLIAVDQYYTIYQFGSLGKDEGKLLAGFEVATLRALVLDPTTWARSLSDHRWQRLNVMSRPSKTESFLIFSSKNYLLSPKWVFNHHWRFFDPNLEKRKRPPRFTAETQTGWPHWGLIRPDLLMDPLRVIQRHPVLILSCLVLERAT